MDPITAEVLIDRPREEIFEYLADVANHSEFTDHYRVHWRLTREDPFGVGAGARFKVKAPRNRFAWGDLTFTEMEPPRRIVERGRMGKYNRIRTLGLWDLDQSGSGTRVRYSFETLPKYPTDRLMEAFGARAWYKRKIGKSMRRLRAILEDDLDRGPRVTVAAGGARKPASAYRFTTSADR